MTRVELHLDQETLGPIINEAVDAAFRRMRDERSTDDAGRLLWDKRTAAERLSVSVSTFDRLVKDGEIKVVKLSGRLLVSPDAVREFIANKELALAEKE